MYEDLAVKKGIQQANQKGGPGSGTGIYSVIDPIMNLAPLLGPMGSLGSIVYRLGGLTGGLMPTDLGGKGWLEDREEGGTVKYGRRYRLHPGEVVNAKGEFIPEEDGTIIPANTQPINTMPQPTSNIPQGVSPTLPPLTTPPQDKWGRLAETLGTIAYGLGGKDYWGGRLGGAIAGMERGKREAGAAEEERRINLSNLAMQQQEAARVQEAWRPSTTKRTFTGMDTPAQTIGGLNVRPLGVEATTIPGGIEYRGAEADIAYKEAQIQKNLVGDVGNQPVPEPILQQSGLDPSVYRGITWDQLKSGGIDLQPTVKEFAPKEVTIYGPRGQTKVVSIPSGQEYTPPKGWTLKTPTEGQKLSITDVKAVVGMRLNNIKQRMLLKMTPDEQMTLAGQPTENIMALLLSGRIGKALAPTDKDMFMRELNDLSQAEEQMSRQVLGGKGLNIPKSAPISTEQYKKGYYQDDANKTWYYDGNKWRYKEGKKWYYGTPNL